MKPFDEKQMEEMNKQMKEFKYLYKDKDFEAPPAPAAPKGAPAPHAAPAPLLPQTPQ